MQSVKLNPADLLKALQPVLKKRLKVIIMWAKEGRLSVADAKYHAVVAEIPCAGDWRGPAEIEAQHFKKILMILHDKETVSLLKESRHITISSGSFSIDLKRLDPNGKGRTKQQPLPHKGKVKHQPGPSIKRAEYGDTWKFSARVPLPAKAYNDRPKDWDKE